MRSWCARSLIALALMPACAFASTAGEQAALQQQLDQINAQIAQNQSQLAARQKQRVSLERDVAILDSQIQEAQLEIKQRDLTILQLKGGIAQEQSSIDILNGKIASGEQSLAEIIRQTNEIDRTPLSVQLLRGNVSDAFEAIDSYAALQKALGDAFTAMGVQKNDLSSRKEALQNQQQEQNDLLQLQLLQQQSLKQTESQKQQLVVAAKGQEALYQQAIANQQKTAAEIKAQLFSLNNANHSTSFGDMYQYAKEASVATGVEPAFILAILTEESNLGQNVGDCTYGQSMSPNRDVPQYLEIVQQLGLDPNAEKVSCAQSYGAYGGAMGPAQFIPSTWMLYQARIAHASGQDPPNPWDPRTATFATAIYMSDLGADTQTPAAERQAALRYLAGSHWQNPAYAFYGEAVMSYTAQYQQNIQVLNAG